MASHGIGSTTSIGDALALLALPALDGLTDDQTRGAICVWDRHEDRLTAETAVDLGEHMSPLNGSTSLMRWFPRGCRHHTGQAALRALHEHAPMCEPCVDNAAECETGRALRRIIRDAHRGTLTLADQLDAATLPCEPCMTARIVGGDHQCTGTAGTSSAGRCPCCGPRAD